MCWVITCTTQSVKCCQKPFLWGFSKCLFTRQQSLRHYLPAFLQVSMTRPQIPIRIINVNIDFVLYIKLNVINNLLCAEQLYSLFREVNGVPKFCYDDLHLASEIRFFLLLSLWVKPSFRYGVHTF